MIQGNEQIYRRGKIFITLRAKRALVISLLSIGLSPFIAKLIFSSIFKAFRPKHRISPLVKFIPSIITDTFSTSPDSRACYKKFYFILFLFSRSEQESWICGGKLFEIFLTKCQRNLTGNKENRKGNILSMQVSSGSNFRRLTWFSGEKIFQKFFPCHFVM